MRRLTVAAVLLVVCVPAALARTWTDSTGKYTVEAEFVEMKDGKVHLKKEDGRIVAVPIQRLSEADQKFAQDAASQQLAPNGFLVGIVKIGRLRSGARLAAGWSWRDDQAAVVEPGNLKGLMIQRVDRNVSTGLRQLVIEISVAR